MLLVRLLGFTNSNLMQTLSHFTFFKGNLMSFLSHLMLLVRLPGFTLRHLGFTLSRLGFILGHLGFFKGYKGFTLLGLMA